MKYSISEIASVLQASSTSITNPNAVIAHLLTDSRSLTFADETLFFAIKTKNNDGHRYINNLYELGVRNFVVEHTDGMPSGANYIVTPNTLEALQQLATYHRSRFNIPVIAITGSRGKTCAKEWLYQLLNADYRIVRSPRSFNSQIGVPLSLWEINENTDLAIIEAGISMPGEMQRLEAIIRPTMGIMTSLTAEHGENFASLQEKASEKAKLFAHCQTIVLNADNGTMMQAVAQYSADKAFWSRTDASEASMHICKSSARNHNTEIKYTYKGATHTVSVPTVNINHINNAINCLMVMLQLGIDADTATKRIAMLTPVQTRINVIEGMNGCIVVSDSYPSDFNSLSGALDFMARQHTPSMHRTAIISDTADVSINPELAYAQMAELLANRGIERIIGIGDNIGRYGHLFAGERRFFRSTQEFLNAMSPSDFENELILVKGAAEYDFHKIVDMLEAKLHQTVMEVNLDALSSNYNFFRSLVRPTTKFVCMLKASGYGAGSYELARTLEDSGVAYIAVAAHDEGVDLRKAGITAKIMVLNPRVENYKAMFTYDLEPEVYGIDECREIIREAEKYGISNYPVHIKLDTGMHRLGFLKEQLPELLTLLNSQSAIRPASVFSHLCVADEPDKDAYTMQQFQYFDECCEILQAGTKHHIIRHILNTTGIVRFPEHQCDMVRLGIGLYGISTTSDGSESSLIPVSSLHSVVISIKEWPAGTTIGYGQRGVLKRQSRIATIPIGYADGIDRHFGNGNINMWVNGTLCPTVGNICMDVCMIDVTDAECSIGDNVEIFGEHIPVERLAEVRQTIPYEILTSISTRVKRVYYRE